MKRSAGPDATLHFIWSQYRSWADTAVRLKNEISLWRLAVLVLTIVGALAAILSQEFSEPYGKLAGWISAAAVGIAGYAGSKMLSGDKEKKWIQARAAAQQCKSHAYRYLLKVSPYGNPEDDVLIFKIAEDLIRSLSSIPQLLPKKELELKGVPPEDYSFDDYLRDRIKTQAYDYYSPKAAECAKKLRYATWTGVALSVTGFILGSLGASGQYAHLSVWVAFISTATASITSFVAASRYQYLSMSYKVMANQLMVLWSKGSRIEKHDLEKQRQFISNCEEILAAEGEGWVTEMTRREQPETPEPEEKAVSHSGTVL